MQPNPFLTILKILVFAALAFLILLSTCQQSNVEKQIARLSSKTEALAGTVEELSRSVEAGGGVRAGPGTAGAAKGVDWAAKSAELDAHLDPSRPVGTPGRYKNFGVPDPDPEVPAAAAGHDQGEAAFPLGSEPRGFNSVTQRSGPVNEFIETYVLADLLRRHRNNPTKWAPDLCWRVEVSPDYKEWTLFLRPDATWHTPAVDVAKYPHLAGRHPVLAEDLAFTYDIILNPQTDSGDVRNYYSDVESYRAIDDHTFVVKWKETLHHSISFTLQLTIMPKFLYGHDEAGKPFPAESLGVSFNNHFYNRLGVCGCGPYRFASYEPGQRVILERDEGWYGLKDGIRYPLKRLTEFIYSDPEVGLNKLKAGEMDLGGLSAPQWKKEVLDNKDPASPFVNGEILHTIGPKPSYMWFGWKNTNPLFTDKRVRKALALACNREAICKKIFLDRFTPMASPVYPSSPEADPELKPLPFDLDAAKALLEEAGWKLNPSTGLREKEIGGEKKVLDFTLIWPGPAPDFLDALNQVKNDLLTIGVKMTPQSMQWAVFQKKTDDREFEACSMLWSDNGWEHDFVQIWHSREIQEPKSSNFIEFSNPEVDRLSDALRREMDPEKRIQMVRRIGRVLYEEQPYCFFGWQNILRVYRSHMKNVDGPPYKIRPFLRLFPVWDARPH